MYKDWQETEDPVEQLRRFAARSRELDEIAAATDEPDAEERRERIVRKLASLSMDSPDYAAQRADLLAQQAAIEAEIEAAFTAEWTKQVTAERSSAWNDAVRAGQIKTGLDMTRWYREHGWGHQQLVRATALYS